MSPEENARAPISLDDCYIYHWFDLPDGRTIPGQWDLRAGWREYLGNVDFAGQRVLEVGPASGFLSHQMERMGADVTALELPDDALPDLMPIPRPGSDLATTRQEYRRTNIALRKSWQYFHDAFGSKNRRVSGTAYDLPKSLGRFDTTVIGAVLLHLSNPLAAVLQAASVTDHRIIVVELYDQRLDGGGFMEFDPNDGAYGPGSWWLISPIACQRMLRMAGFPNFTLTYHQHQFHRNRRADEFITLGFFTIVATR